MYAHHPSENWFRYLILLSGLSFKEIIDLAGLTGVQPPDEQYLASLKLSLEKTKPKPFSLRSQRVKAWLRRQRLWSMASGHPAVADAREILQSDRIRMAIEGYLLAGADVCDMPKLLQDYSNKKVSRQVLDMYRHYFWNRDLMSPRDWVAFLASHPMGGLYLEFYSQDAGFVAWKLGYRPEVDEKEALRGIFVDSVMRFRSLRNAPNDRNTALTGKLWSETAFGALTEMAKSGDAVQEILDELRRMTVKLDGRKVPSIESLGMLAHTPEEGINGKREGGPD